MIPNPGQMGSNYIRKPLMAFPLEQLQPQTIHLRIPEISIHINEMIFFKAGVGQILFKVLKVKYKYSRTSIIRTPVRHFNVKSVQISKLVRISEISDKIHYLAS